MITYQTHWTEGRGLPGTPKGAPRVASGTLAETADLVKRLRVLWERGMAHSISVFDVNQGARFNVTDSFVKFDSRPRAVGAEMSVGQTADMVARMRRATV